MTAKETLEEKQQNLPKFGTEGADLQRTIELVSSLVSLSYSIRVFPSKWQLIRSKVEQLNSSLIAAENCNSQDNTLLSPVLQSIQSTVVECRGLAHRCIDLSYSGKLLMQSDLDVASSKFDHHLKDLSKIYTAGIMKNSYAIVVSRPSGGAGCNDMKFYIKDLHTRMMIGDLEMKNQALISLNEILHEDKKYVKIAAESGEFIKLLVNFLEYKEVNIREEATEAVSTMAGFDSCKFSLIEAGVITSLIRVLEDGTNVSKERAARALQKLTANSENVWSVSAHGGVTALLKICSDNNSPGELIGSATSVLKTLATVDEIKRYMVEEGAISVFMKLLRSNDKITQIASIEFLHTLASTDESARQMFIREGGIRSLVRFLNPNLGFSSKTQEIALRAINSLCLTSMNSFSILVSTTNEFFFWVLSLMHKGDTSIQEAAAQTAFCLCLLSEETKKAMGEAGFVQEFIGLLDSKSHKIREMAVEALFNMVTVSKNKKRFIQEGSSVDRIMQLLDLEKKSSGINKFVLSMLLSFTYSKTGRKKIATSRFLKLLDELAESEVTEAKRIIKRLSENRLFSLFNGGWKY